MQKSISGRLKGASGLLLLLAGAGGLFFKPAGLRADTATRNEIEREIQQIRERGEPVTLAELVPEEIPESGNGAGVYRQAFQLFQELKTRNQERWKHIPREGGMDWKTVPAREKAEVRNLLLGNPDFIRFYQLLEKAAGMRCQFLRRSDYRGIETELPHLASLRSCARMLAARADLKTDAGDIDGALRDCLTGLRLAGTLDEEPVIISGLIRIAIDNIMLNCLEEVLQKGEAAPETGRELVMKIRAERESRLLYRGLLGERVLFGLPIFRRLGEKAGQKADLDQLAAAYGAENKLKAFLAADTDLAGLIETNMLTYLRAMAKLISLYELPYGERQAKTIALQEELLKLPDRKAILVKLAMPALLNLPLNENRLDARLGNAMIALACRRYREKQGAWPESLKELSPEKAPGFLPELPLDPFTGREYVYRKRGRGFIVYSLGENLKDEGGRRGEGAKRWDYDIVWQE